MLEAILQPLIQWVTATIGGYGLFAVFALMLLESTGILIPSEAISPFAGYLVSLGKMSFLGALTAGVLGNLAGSWIAYFIGLFGGRELWLRYGRYVGVRAHHLHLAEHARVQLVALGLVRGHPLEIRHRREPGRHHPVTHFPDRRTHHRLPA